MEIKNVVWSKCLFVFIFGFLGVLASAALNSSAVSSQHHLSFLYAAAAGHVSTKQTTD